MYSHACIRACASKSVHMHVCSPCVYTCCVPACHGCRLSCPFVPSHLPTLPPHPPTSSDAYFYCHWTESRRQSCWGMSSSSPFGPMVLMRCPALRASVSVSACLSPPLHPTARDPSLSHTTRSGDQKKPIPWLCLWSDEGQPHAPPQQPHHHHKVPLEAEPLDLQQRKALIEKYSMRAEADKRHGKTVLSLSCPSRPLCVCLCVHLCPFASHTLSTSFSLSPPNNLLSPLCCLHGKAMFACACSTYTLAPSPRAYAHTHWHARAHTKNTMMHTHWRAVSKAQQFSTSIPHTLILNPKVVILKPTPNRSQTVGAAILLLPTAPGRL